MKRVVIKSLVAVFATMSLVSCSATAPSPEAHMGHINKSNFSQEKIQNMIVEAAEAKGWVMTKFKSNQLVAEKPGKNGTVSTTVTHSTSSFDIEPANSELESIINDALN